VGDGKEIPLKTIRMAFGHGYTKGFCNFLFFCEFDGSSQGGGEAIAVSLKRNIAALSANNAVQESV